ncbi:MAG: hypothetical protein QX199_17120 [Methylococcaceae bacterium]
MKKIFVHVGTHKTGSSAIQKFLTQNRDNLIKYNYRYDFIPEEGINHSTLDFVNKGQELQLDNNFNYIFSSEDLYINFECIKCFLLDKSNEFEIKIIIYLRRQDIMKQAVYNQIVKMGHFAEKIYQDHHYNLDYSVFLGKMSKLFSKRNIIVRPYESSQFYGGSIYADFLNILGLKLSSDFQFDDEVVNPSLSNDGLEYCLYINKLNLAFSVRDQINKMVIQLESITKHHRMFREHNILPPVRRRKIIAAYSVSNAKIAREYLNRSNGMLFTDPLPDINEPWSSPLCINQEKAYSITKSIYSLNRSLIYNAFKHTNFSSGNPDYYSEAKDFLLPVFRKVLSEFEIKELEKDSSENDVLRKVFETLKLYCALTPDNFFDLIYNYTPNISKKSIVGGYIELVSTGGDPFFELLPLTINDGSVTYIKLIIDSPAKTIAQCFFNIKNSSYYPTECCIERQLDKGLNEVYFIIDDARFSGQLRIDPGTIAGVFKIKEIIIKTSY